MKRTALLGCFLVVVLTAAGYAQNATVTRPTLYPSTAESRELLDDQISRAISLAQAENPDLVVGYQGFATAVPGPRGGARIDIVANRTDGGDILSFTARQEGRTSAYAYTLRWTAALYRDLAAIISYLAGMVGGETSAVVHEPPVHLFDLNTAHISTGDLAYPSPVYPYGVSPYGPDGYLIAAANFVVSTDQYFRERGKLGIDRATQGTWAMMVAGTDGGSVIAASMAQGGLSRYVPGIDDPFVVPTPGAAQSLAVLEDGSILVKDIQQNILRIEQGRTEGVRFESLATPYIAFMEAGPDNTVWVWDQVLRAALIYDARGTRRGILLPHLSQEEAGMIRFMRPYPDGGLLIVTMNGLHRFDRSGKRLWHVTTTDLPRMGIPSSYFSVSFHPTTGAVSLVNVAETRITQLLDVDYVRSMRPITDEERRLLDLSKRLDQSPMSVDLFVEQAELLESMEAWELASSAWAKAASLDPTNREAAAGKVRAEVEMLRRSAGRAYQRTVRTLNEIGPASAQLPYQNALRLYEEILSRAPQDDARKEMEQLQELMEAPAQRREPGPLEISGISIPELFPALVTSYRSGNAGTLELRNPSDDSVTGIVIQIDSRFLEYPVTVDALESIPPGASVEVPLPAPIGDETLALREDTPVPVQILVSYRVGASSYTLDASATATVRRATALVWDRSEKLAPFVTPNDEVVELFAFSARAEGATTTAMRFSQRLFRAARVADTLGAYGIEYVEDPQSGITRVFGNASLVDTVRFPRTTLRYQAGDCDDTTALLASLLEATGIPTAIMTSPGHVFLAFDTGEPVANGWLFESESTTFIGHQGTVWLPLETTNLSDGFVAAWAEGSRLHRRYRSSGQIEFIPLKSARQEFPPLPIQGSPSYSIVPPGETLRAERIDLTMQGLRATLYEDHVSELEESIPNRGQRTQVRIYNRLGILHGLFGESDRARGAFGAAVELDPEYTASYINLANLRLLAGDPSGALAFLDEARERDPGDPIGVLLRAQAEASLGHLEEARNQMAILRRVDPDLAARYDHLAGEGAGRASQATPELTLPWAADQE